MNENNETMEKAKNWVLDKFDAAKFRMKCAAQWCKDHPKEAVEIVGLALTGAGMLVKIGERQAKKAHDQNRMAIKELEFLSRACSVYDRSNGFYYETIRPMTNYERNEFDRRKKSGERVGAILSDMDLI